MKKLIDEALKEQNLKLSNVELLVKDELDFQLYPNLPFIKSKLIIPKYLTAESLNDLKSTYINELLKKEYGIELKNTEQWFSEDGKKLISSFLLTDDAKKFLISTNLHSLKNNQISTYYVLSSICFYVFGQLIKWQKDLSDLFKDPKFQQRRSEQLKPKFWRSFFFRYQKSVTLFFTSTWLMFCTVLYYCAGVKNSRDSDALTLSRGLANATLIKSRNNLIDFNYYSGGEEAYRKILDRNQSLNNLFYKDVNGLERFFKFIPITKEGNKFTYFSNEVPILSAYENLNNWEKSS